MNVDSRVLETLKVLALHGAMHIEVTLTSAQLAELLRISQQSASTRILELLKINLITRRLIHNRQIIRITEEGIKILRKEYASYERIFKYANELIITGTVTSGLGEGRYYISQMGYFAQLKKILNANPYRGTLNIRLSNTERIKIDILDSYDGKIIKGFQTKKRTFGDVKYYYAELKGLHCIVILPMRSHHKDTIEIVSSHHLRKKLNLKDNDTISLKIKVDC